MAILITGVEGFLGHRIAKTLHEKDYLVIGLDVMNPQSNPPWTFIKGNVTDLSLIESIFNNNLIDQIIHCGGISGPHVCNQEPAKVFEINVLGTLNLFETARKKKMEGRIILVSSSSVYGEPAEKISCNVPLVEKTPLLANEPYGCSKVACESLVRAYSQQFDLDAISLRVSIVYGPGRTTYCGITEMLNSARMGKPIILRQGCDLPLPWIHIDDLNGALLTALDAKKNQFKQTETLAYNVTGPGYPTFREIAQIVQKIFPKATIVEKDEPDPYAMNARKMSIDAMESDLGWVPQVTIDKGILSFIHPLD